MLLPELKSLAGQLGIAGSSGMRKADLVAAIGARSSSDGPATTRRGDTEARPARTARRSAVDVIVGDDAVTSQPTQTSLPIEAGSNGSAERPARSTNRRRENGNGAAREKSSAELSNSGGSDALANESTTSPVGDAADGGDTSRSERSFDRGDRQSRQRDRPSRGDRQNTDRQNTDRPVEDRQQGDRPQNDRQQGSQRPASTGVDRPPVDRGNDY